MLARCTKQQPPGYLELLTILTFQAHQLQTAALAQEDTPCFASANAWKNRTMNCSGGFTKAHCCCCAKLHQRRQPGKCFRKVAAALPCKTLFREGMAASPRSKKLGEITNQGSSSPAHFTTHFSHKSSSLCCALPRAEAKHLGWRCRVFMARASTDGLHT